LATRREHNAAFLTEFHQLQTAWVDEFVNVEDREERAMEDMHHIPPALRRLLEEILLEGTDAINENLAEDLVDVATVPDNFDIATAQLLAFARMTGARMYRLGTRMASILPYKDMTPCPCAIMTDEDFEDLESYLKSSISKPEE